MTHDTDLVNYTIGYLVVKAHLVAYMQGRDLDSTWRLVLHQDDYANLVTHGEDSMDLLEGQCAAPLRVLDQDTVEVRPGQPIELRGQLLVIPPEEVQRLGLE